jgi:hypothetical protein
MRTQTKVLYFLGTTITAIAFVLQGYILWLQWSVARINQPLVDKKIDLTAGYHLETTFVANWSAKYDLSFRLHTNLPYDERNNLIERNAFHISYRIMQDSQEIATGLITNENIHQIGHGAGVCSIIGKNPKVALKSGCLYKLITEVEKGSAKLNELKPTIVLRTTYYPLKGRVIISKLIAGRASLWFLLSGICFLLAGVWQHLLDKSKQSCSKQQNQRE